MLEGALILMAGLVLGWAASASHAYKAGWRDGQLFCPHRHESGLPTDDDWNLTT